MAGGDESCDQIDQKADVAGWRECSSLSDVIELIIDGLDDGSFA